MSEPTATNIYTALLAAQEAMPSIGRDTEGQVGPRKYKYAALPSILDQVGPVLRNNGIVLLQRPVMDGELLFMETVLYHAASATEITGRTPLPIPDDWQRWGSAVTYARRYSLLPMLGIAPDDDDDGASAQGYSATPRQRRASGPSQDELFLQARAAGLRALRTLFKSLNNEEAKDAQKAWVETKFPELIGVPASEFTLTNWNDIITLAEDEASDE